MMRELFEFTAEDDEKHDSELGINREDRAMSESDVEARAVVEPEDQARYNKFMETFYRRLNADARTTIDPLGVPLPAGKRRILPRKERREVQRRKMQKRMVQRRAVQRRTVQRRMTRRKPKTKKIIRRIRIIRTRRLLATPSS